MSTAARLRAHRKAQRVLQMKNRTTYTDFGLVFAKEPEDLQTPKAKIGQPLKTLEANIAAAISPDGLEKFMADGKVGDAKPETETIP